MSADKRTPLLTVEDLLAATTCNAKAARQRYCFPHPLSRFALHGGIVDGPHADALMDTLDASIFEDPGSPYWRTANWFLLESQMFFEFCAAAGVDARKWRRHLRRVSRVIHHHRRRTSTL